jgi:hypothetical protein
MTAVEAPHLHFQKNPRVAARQIAHAPHLVILMHASKEPIVEQWDDDDCDVRCPNLSFRHTRLSHFFP